MWYRLQLPMLQPIARCYSLQPDSTACKPMLRCYSLYPDATACNPMVPPVARWYQVSVQPLPSRLPRTQRHLGALTAELMPAEGGPVYYGKTIALRGRGGRYVDAGAHPTFSPSL